MSSLYNGILIDKTFNLKYILALLNSKLFLFQMNKIAFEKTRGLFTKARIFHYHKLPIKIISKHSQQPFIKIANYILYLKKQDLKSEEELLMSAYFEQIIDVMVYELYFEELLKEHNHNILKHLNNLPEITETQTDKEKMQIITNQFNIFYDSNHPVRNILANIKNIEEIRIIEEGA